MQYSPTLPALWIAVLALSCLLPSPEVWASEPCQCVNAEYRWNLGVNRTDIPTDVVIYFWSSGDVEIEGLRAEFDEAEALVGLEVEDLTMPGGNEQVYRLTPEENLEMGMTYTLLFQNMRSETPVEHLSFTTGMGDEPLDGEALSWHADHVQGQFCTSWVGLNLSSSRLGRSIYDHVVRVTYHQGDSSETVYLPPCVDGPCDGVNIPLGRDFNAEEAGFYGSNYCLQNAPAIEEGEVYLELSLLDPRGRPVGEVETLSTAFEVQEAMSYPGCARRPHLNIGKACEAEPKPTPTPMPAFLTPLVYGLAIFLRRR